MKIHSIQEAEKILHKYIPAATKTGDGQSLDRMWPVLERVGNPHQKLCVIHTAGTSGKTSTSYYIAALLRASGKSVGLTISPHIDSITERMQIDGNSVSDAQFIEDLSNFLDLLDGDMSLSYFELLIIFVLWAFVRHRVDYVVLETGMGGLLDGTNVVTREDKVCVITDIGYDHMNILGNTLTEIGAQKAGIIHEGNVVFSQQQNPEAQAQIDARSELKHAKIEHIDTAEIANNLQFTSYQQRNFVLAHQAASYVAKRDGFQLQNINPESVLIPGRMEIRTLEDSSTLIMDGAHNEQKMQSFVASYRNKFPSQKATILLAMKEGKEYKKVIDELLPIAESFIVTKFTAYQDVPFHAHDPTELAGYIAEKGSRVTIIDNSYKAYSALLRHKGIKIVTGSFYLIGELHKK